MNRITCGLLAAVLCHCTSHRLPAEHIVGWRSNGTGMSSSAKPPLEWSPRKNIAWSVAFSTRSNALPVVVGGRVFVCAEPHTLVCLDERTGKQLWKRTHSYREVSTPEQLAKAQAQRQAAQRHRAIIERAKARKDAIAGETGRDPQSAEEALAESDAAIAKSEAALKELTLAASYELPKLEQLDHNGFTTATPVSDGRHVWAVFGHRVVVCYDLAGERKWARVLSEHPQAMWGHSSSPALVDGKLIVNIQNTLALDAATGKTVWSTKYGQSWGSLAVAEVGDDHLLLLANGRVVRASDGKVLTRINQLAKASPFVHDGVAYSIGLRAAAYRLPQSAKGDRAEFKELWTAELKGGEFYASSVVLKGKVYAVSTKGILNVIDAADGRVLLTRRLDLGRGPVWPSLCAAGGHVFASSRDGTTVVLDGSPQAAQVARNRLEPFISTPVFHEDAIYIRTFKRLYKVSAQSAPE